MELEIEYECYGVTEINRGKNVRTPRPEEEREKLTSADDFASVLFGALQWYNLDRFSRLEFKAIDKDTGEEWHIQRTDFNEALDSRIRENLQLLEDSLEKSGESK